MTKLASLDTSRQIYERLGWTLTAGSRWGSNQPPIEVRPPQYATDYLLDKLLAVTSLDIFRDGNRCVALASSRSTDDETPAGEAENTAEALGLLVLKLADMGVLKRR